MKTASRKHGPVSDHGSFPSGTKQVFDAMAPGVDSRTFKIHAAKKANDSNPIAAKTCENDCYALQYLPEPIPSQFSKNKARTYNTLQIEKRLAVKNCKQTKVTIVGEGFKRNINQCTPIDYTKLNTEDNIILSEHSHTTDSGGRGTTMLLSEEDALQSRLIMSETFESQGQNEKYPIESAHVDLIENAPQPCLIGFDTSDPTHDDSETLQRESGVFSDKEFSNDFDEKPPLEATITSISEVPELSESIAQDSDQSQQRLEWDSLDLTIQRLEAFVAIHNKSVHLSACEDGIKLYDIPKTRNEMDLELLGISSFVLWWSSPHNQQRSSFLDNLQKEALGDKNILRAWIDSIEKEGEQQDILCMLSKLLESSEHDETTSDLKKLAGFYFSSKSARLTHLEYKVSAIERECMKKQTDEIPREESVPILEAIPRPQNAFVDFRVTLEISQAGLETPSPESSILEGMQTNELEEDSYDERQCAQHYNNDAQESFNWPLEVNEPNAEIADAKEIESHEIVPEGCFDYPDSDIFSNVAAEFDDASYRSLSSDNGSGNDEFEEVKDEEHLRMHPITLIEPSKEKNGGKEEELLEAVKRQWNIIQQRQKQIEVLLLNEERANMEAEDARGRTFLSVLTSERTQMQNEDQLAKETRQKQRSAIVFEARRWLYDQAEIQQEDQRSAQYEEESSLRRKENEEIAISPRRHEIPFQPLDFPSTISPLRMLNEPVKKLKKLCGSYAIPFADSITEEELSRDTYVASASKKFYQLLGLRDLDGDFSLKGSRTKSRFLPFPSKSHESHKKNYLSKNAPSRAYCVNPSTDKDCGAFPKLVTKSSWKYKVNDPFVEPDERNNNVEDKRASLPFFRGHFGIQGRGKVHLSNQK